MKHGFIILVLICMSSLGSAGDIPAVIGQMEGFRTKIPPPQTLSEQNGFGIKDIKGEYYLLTHLSGVAERMNVDGKQNMIILMSYLKDADLKIRFIAAKAMEKELKAFPSGMSLRDVTDLHSDGHARMVSAFAKKIAEQSAAQLQSEGAPSD